MTETPEPLDDGHLLPEPEWQAVVDLAELEAARITRGEPAPEAPVEHGFGTGLLPLSGVVTAARHGGARKAPTFGVLHSAETPLAAGYAAAIARMFRDTTADKSCHYMTDPAETWGVLDDLLTAWHCGTGNTNSIGLEQAGRAAMTRAEWLVPAGRAQLERNAAIMRAARSRFGIGCYWMTDQQIRDAHARKIVGGWCTHDDARRVLGGTTHTDPGTGFPRDVQMQLANAEPAGEDDLMAAADDILKRLDALDDKLGGLVYAEFPEGGVGSEGEQLKLVRRIDQGVLLLLARDPSVDISAADIAAAIPEGIAREVADELAARLKA